MASEERRDFWCEHCLCAVTEVREVVLTTGDIIVSCATCHRVIEVRERVA